ncbi:hypothetical protein AB0P21_36850 [Kribbella sp. NPDC056861]
MSEHRLTESKLPKANAADAIGRVKTVETTNPVRDPRLSDPMDLDRIW